MEMIRGWVLALCSLALLYTILEGFLPEKEPFPVIKLTCVLYILIALLTPAKQTVFKAALPQLPDEASVTAAGEDFYKEKVLEQAEASLETALAQGLSEKGIDIENVTVHLEPDDDGNIGTPWAEIVLSGEAQEVPQAVCELLGCEAVVTVKEV
ncbi:MAG: hypothetical protein Q4G07_08265 [Oscillospiraceae bacterium]|nr:hypothetical protein [Oscillospiraceae bacterium]